LQIVGDGPASYVRAHNSMTDTKTFDHRQTMGRTLPAVEHQTVGQSHALKGKRTGGCNQDLGTVEFVEEGAVDLSAVGDRVLGGVGEND